MKYSIESRAWGAFMTIKRLSDGASVFLQGDDAIRFNHELELAYTDDEAASKYDDVLTAPHDEAVAGVQP